MFLYTLIFLIIYRIIIVVGKSDIFYNEEQTITVINGSEALLKCYIMVTLNYSQFLNVSWIKSPRQILTRGFFRVTENNRFHLQQPAILNTQIFHLKIFPVFLDDEGQYRCNFIYGRKIFAKVVNLIVEVPPKMIKHPSPLVKVDEGKCLKLTCMAIGKPLPKYNWFMMVSRDEEIKLTSIPEAIGKYDTDISISEGNLTVDKTNRFMKGTYRCEAQNKVGLIHWDTKILVLYPPEIFMANEVITQSINQNTVIVCSLSSYPLGVVNWSFEPGNITLRTNLCGIINDNSIKFCMVEHRPNSDNGEVKLISKLTLFRLTSADFGTYVCKCTTILGSATGMTQLKMSPIKLKDEDILTPEDKAYRSLREDASSKNPSSKNWQKVEEESPKSMEQSQHQKRSSRISSEILNIFLSIIFIILFY